MPGGIDPGARRLIKARTALGNQKRPESCQSDDFVFAHAVLGLDLHLVAQALIQQGFAERGLRRDHVDGLTLYLDRNPTPLAYQEMQRALAVELELDERAITNGIAFFVFPERAGLE